MKIENTRRHGATVIEGGATLEEAATLAKEHGASCGLTYIHPYDDPLIIAGQGTIALEMLASVPDLDVLIVPIGGGGLISGMAVAAKTLKPGYRDRRRAGGALSVDVQRDQGAIAADARRHAGGRHCGQGAGRDHVRDRAGAGRRHRSGDRAAISSMR